MAGVEMNHQEHQLRSRWQGYIGVLPASYRALAFAIAAAQIFLFPAAYDSVIPAIFVVSAVGIYTLFKALYPLRWYTDNVLSHTVLGADVAVCIFLILSTGGLHSPFVLYSLAPVLTAALVASRKVTFSIAGLSVASALAAHLANPLPLSPLPLTLSYFFLFAAGVALTSVLPYLINVKLRQHLHSQDVLQERQRLSHEIHDGSAQALAGLRWQAQLIRRRLAERGIDLDEVRQLESLAEKAHRDTRESMELLRGYTGNGSLLSYLQEYLKHLSQDSGIDFRLDIEADGLHLEAPVELELVRICQEALTNIRKHSGTYNARVKLRLVDNHLNVSISDEGCGFDAVAYYHDGVEAKGHGLAVMRERAESIGGRLRVLSLPGQGCEVQVEVPVNPRRRRWLWR